MKSQKITGDSVKNESALHNFMDQGFWKTEEKVKQIAP